MGCLCVPTVKHILGALVREGPDHRYTIARASCYRNGDPSYALRLSGAFFGMCRGPRPPPTDRPWHVTSKIENSKSDFHGVESGGADVDLARYGGGDEGGAEFLEAISGWAADSRTKT